MHADYDHFVCSITFQKKYKFQPKSSIFSRNNNPFSIKPTVVWVKIFEKKNISFFRFVILLQQASKWKETYFAIRKILQNLEEHDHWHLVIYNFSKSMK